MLAEYHRWMQKSAAAAGQRYEPSIGTEYANPTGSAAPGRRYPMLLEMLRTERIAVDSAFQARLSQADGGKFTERVSRGQKT